MTRDWAGNYIDLSEPGEVPKLQKRAASHHESEASMLETTAETVAGLLPFAKSKSEKQALRRTRAFLYRQARDHRALARTVRQETESRGRP